MAKVFKVKYSIFDKEYETQLYPTKEITEQHLFDLQCKGFYNAKIEEKELPHGSNALILRPDGRILAIKRNHSPIGYGLIGGKVEPGETDEEGLIREVREESGLTVVAYQKVFERISVSQKFWVSTYQCLINGEIKSSSEGEIVWATMQDLINGPFGVYNKELFLKLGCII